jgi:hypothetical protein
MHNTNAYVFYSKYINNNSNNNNSDNSFSWDDNFGTPTDFYHPSTIIRADTIFCSSKEELEDTKGAIRNRVSKNKQHKG